MASREWLHVNQVRPDGTAAVFEQSSFTLSAAPSTDIYASPLTKPTLHVYSAPISHTQLKKTSFISARVTISFVPTLQFDQGGLIFTIPTKTNSDPRHENSADAANHPAWIKAGIEVNDGEAWLSVVAKERKGWCDWNMAPLFGATTRGLGKAIAATIEIARYRNALMVYAVEAERKVLIRKIPWVFLDDDCELSERAWVGTYAARPDPDSQSAGTALQLHFDNLSVSTT